MIIPPLQLASDKAMSVVLSRVPSNGLMKNYIDVNTGESSGAITLGNTCCKSSVAKSVVLHKV